MRDDVIMNAARVFGTLSITAGGLLIVVDEDVAFYTSLSVLVDMSPSLPRDMRIAIPARRNPLLAWAESDSNPSTPGPHTPLPYCEGLSLAHGIGEESGNGKKRSREDDAEEAEHEWKDQEILQIQAALLRPYRPLSTQYPPGDLPPEDVLDELTSQIVKFAQPVRDSTEPVATDQEGGWHHSWGATRRKVFEVALAESKFGKEERERHKPRAERGLRPGLRRVDSMDFLDSEGAEQNRDPGRAARLSTSLQNSAKKESVLVVMARSPSAGSASERKIPDAASLPAGLIITPPSPSSASGSQASRRRSASRSSSGQPRAMRPSLLQRGRSFTASDLQAEARAEASQRQSSPLCLEQKEHLSPSSSTECDEPQLPPAPIASPRITRSQSSISVSEHPPHLLRNAFMTHIPSTGDRNQLAKPFSLNSSRPISGSWSDSDEDGPIRARSAKKPRPVKSRGLKVSPIVDDKSLGGALRSPFEEKAGMSF